MSLWRIWNVLEVTGTAQPTLGQPVPLGEDSAPGLPILEVTRDPKSRAWPLWKGSRGAELVRETSNTSRRFRWRSRSRGTPTSSGVQRAGNGPGMGWAGTVLGRSERTHTPWMPCKNKGLDVVVTSASRAER